MVLLVEIDIHKDCICTFWASKKYRHHSFVKIFIYNIKFYTII